jgi:hypothetical protein
LWPSFSIVGSTLVFYRRFFSGCGRRVARLRRAFERLSAPESLLFAGPRHRRERWRTAKPARRAEGRACPGLDPGMPGVKRSNQEKWPFGIRRPTSLGARGVLEQAWLLLFHRRPPRAVSGYRGKRGCCKLSDPSFPTWLNLASLPHCLRRRRQVIRSRGQ